MSSVQLLHELFGGRTNPADHVVIYCKTFSEGLRMIWFDRVDLHQNVVQEDTITCGTKSFITGQEYLHDFNQQVVSKQQKHAFTSRHDTLHGEPRHTDKV